MVSPQIYEFIGVSRETIIDVACDLVKSGGKGKISVKRIADALSVSSSYILKHVGDASDIQDAVRARALSMLIDVHSDFMTGRCGRAALEAYALGERAFAQAHPALYALAMTAPHSRCSEIKRVTQVYSNISATACRSYYNDLSGKRSLSDIAFCISTALQGCLLAEATQRGGARADCNRNFERMLDILDAACAAEW